MTETPSGRPPEPTVDQMQPADAVTMSAPEALGYELFERVGIGGMGEVYRCGDGALQRDLAIKVIKSELRGDADAEERFLREARLTGSLQHPGIVPIHQLGRLADGRPYYTMKLIRGRTFADMLREEPQGPERLPRLLAVVEKVCQAVAYAHSKGVIHRDLKPANVMVGEFGEVQVMDWGLAKELSRIETVAPVEATEIVETVARAEEAAELSHAGAALGTPNYMSPEQAAGDWDIVDERADVFALGAILCEVLTGRPPYQSGKRDEVLRRARLGDVVEALQRLEQCGTDADLVQVVRECLTPQRDKRPRNAGVVAEHLTAYEAAVQERLRQAELERVAAEIRAREEQMRAAAERRAKRRLLGLTAVVVSSVLLGGIGLAIGMLLLRTEQQRTQEALDQVTAEQTKTQTAWKQTREALNTLTDEVMEELLGKQAVLGEKEKAFLRKALGFYEQFAAQRGEDEEARAVAAEGQLRVAKLRASLGETAEAEQGFRAAVRLSEKLAEDFPAVPAYRAELAHGHNNRGIVLRILGRWEEAEVAFRQARTLREQLVGDFPAVPQHREDLATCYDNLGTLLAELGKHAEAEAVYRTALTLSKKLAEDFAAVPQYRSTLATTYNNLGILLAELDKGAEAEAVYRQALTLKEKLLREFPAVPGYRNALATTYNNLGNLLTNLGKGAEAAAAHRQALRLQEKLVRDFPAVPHYRQLLAGTHLNLGVVLTDLGKGAEAEAALRQALTLHKKMAEDFPTVPQYRGALAGSYNNLGHVLDGLGKGAEAEAALRQALTLHKKMAEDFPTVPDYREALARCSQNLGNLLVELGKGAEAEAAYRQALALREALAHDFPAVPAYRRNLAASYRNLAALLARLHRYTEAEAAFGQARSLNEELVRHFPDMPGYRQDLASSHYNLSCFLSERGKNAEAEAACRKALVLEEKLAVDFPSVPRHRGELALSHTYLGTLLAKLGKGSEAEAAYRQSMTVQEKLAEDFPAVPVYRLDLAGSYGNFGRLLSARGRPKAALDWYGKSILLLETILAQGALPSTARLYLRNDHRSRAEALHQLGRHAEAAKDWQRAAELDDGRMRPDFRLQQSVALARAGELRAAVPIVEELLGSSTQGANAPRSPPLLYDAACVYALSAAAVKEDAKLRQHYAVRALALLRQAQQGGFFKDPRQLDNMRKDPDLNALRQREDFKKFLAELK